MPISPVRLTALSLGKLEFMLRLIAFAAVGALLGGVIVTIVGPPGAGTIAVSIAIPVGILATVLSGVGRSLGGAIGASPQVVEAARAAGRVGIARIDALRQTGTQINDQPLCELDLTVQPLHGPAFASTMRTVVPVTAIPQFQPGTERAVAVLLEGGPEVAFIDSGEAPSQDPWGVTVPARDAVPFIPVERHTRIVDGKRKGPLLGVGRAGRPKRVMLYAVVAIAAAALVVLPYHEAVVQSLSAVQDGRLRADLRQADALGDAHRALESEIGHDRVTSIVVSSDFVIVEAPLVVGETKTDRWTYRGGRVTHDGAAPIQPDFAEEQFAWSDVALDQVWPLLEEGAAQVGLPVGDATVSITRSTDDDIDSETFAHPTGSPHIVFSIGDEYGSTFFSAAADGTGLESN
ncbi:hypothetical protein K8P10_000763 [Leucobacter sp. Psy1]|uniref:hypothetical protein n=1 Tax=Leucobacter sp. Psy1 TaxID=2875729 RepID=UPI001CD278D9|nr:hypothetical protein [Leucobacter sp. Psy1]UBH05252.1 hypothetical protein K8P10_000763 [Leucobacter sp. Psy1]